VVVVIIGRPPEDVGAVLVERLGILGQRVVVATSGSKGLHLSVPLDDPITSS
jgi:DNA primase